MIRANRLREMVHIHKTGHFWPRGMAGMFHWLVARGLVDYVGMGRATLTERGLRVMMDSLRDYTDRGRLSEVFPPTTKDIPRPPYGHTHSSAHRL